MTRWSMLIAVLGLTACKELPERIYENQRVLRDSKRSPAERTVAPSPSYEEYRREREAKPQQ